MGENENTLNDLVSKSGIKSMSGVAFGVTIAAVCAAILWASVRVVILMSTNVIHPSAMSAIVSFASALLGFLAFIPLLLSPMLWRYWRDRFWAPKRKMP